MKYTFLKALLISTTLFLTIDSFSQNNFNHTAELSSMIQAPNSPSAQAFAKYGNTSVNMYIGRPNIGVPVYTHKGREMNLPVSLSYDASGIRANQLATNVGLGWNLAIGGRVSRVVNSMPDEYELISGNPYQTYWDTATRTKINNYIDQGKWFSSKSAVEDYLYFLRDVNEGKIDTQPDYFRVNAPGLSEIIVFDINNGSPTPKALNNPRIKIAYSSSGSGDLTNPTKKINSWTITSDNGTLYKFEEAETTEYINQNVDQDGSQINTSAWRRKFVSSWVLTEMISANDKDTYEFIYDALPLWLQRQYTDPGQSSSVNLSGGPGGGTSGSSSTTTMDIDYRIAQQDIKEIWHNGIKIVGLTKSDRYDLSPGQAKKIDRITIFKTNPIGGNNALMSMDLDYSYFRGCADVSSTVCSSTPFADALASQLRLKLTGLSINNENETESQEYHFEYFNNSVPQLGQASLDYLGYFTGGHVGSAGIYYPSYIIPNVINLTGANRGLESQGEHTKISGMNAMLTKIYYPTGGHTEFEFGPATKAVQDGYVLGQSKIQLSLTGTSSNLNNFNPESCNSPSPSNTNGAITSAETSGTFTVTVLDYDNNTDLSRYMVDVVRTGVATTPSLWPREKTVMVVKINDPSAPLNYNDIYDANCNLIIEPEKIVWEYTDDYDSDNASIKRLARSFHVGEGSYQVLIVNPHEGITYAVDIIESTTSTATYKNIVKAGFQIRQIRDYSNHTTISRKRTYEYPDGKVIWEPQLIKSSYQTIMHSDGIERNDLFLHRYASDYGGDKPHIVYPTVIERTLDYDDNASSGYVVHKYFTGTSHNYKSGIYVNQVSASFQGNVNNFGLDFRLGKNRSSTIKDAQENTLQTSRQNYDYQSFETLRSIGSMSNLNNSHKYVYLYPHSSGNGDWSYGLVNGIYEEVLGGSGQGAIVAPPRTGPYVDTPIEIFNDERLASAYFTKTFAHGRWGMHTDKTTTAFEGEQTLSQTSSYFYYGEDSGFSSGRSSTRSTPPIEIEDPNDDDTDTETTTSKSLGLLHYSVSEDSSGDVVKTTYSYPGNYDTAYSSLKSANILTVPIKTKTYEESVLLGSQKTVFNGTYPLAIYTEKGGVGNSNEERLTFTKYSGGVGKNLLEAKRPNDTPITYIWSYNQRYLVAKIENASFSQVAQALGTSEAALENFSENNLSQLNNLRTVLVKSLVTTYTYIPQVGVETITDPRGYTLTYAYDKFHRLEKVIDKDGNVVEKYNYNTKPFSLPVDPPDDPEIPPLSASGISVDIDNSSNLPYVTYTSEAIFSGGEGSITYHWYRKMGVNGWTDEGTTTTNQYQFTYSVNDTNYCDGNGDPNSGGDIVRIRCLITDSRGDTIEPQSDPRPLVCNNDQQ